MAKRAFRVAFIDDGVLRRKAQEFRQLCGSDELVFPIEEAADLVLQLHVVPVPGLFKLNGVSGYLTADRTAIHVDQDAPEPTYRYTIAHELAHHELHGDLWDELVLETIPDYHVTLREALTDKEYDRLEFQAHALGSLILVPRDKLAPLYWEAVEAKRAMVARSASIDRQMVFDKCVKVVCADVARQFQVVPLTVCVRADYDRLNDTLAEDLFGKDHGLTTRGRMHRR